MDDPPALTLPNIVLLVTTAESKIATSPVIVLFVTVDDPPTLTSPVIIFSNNLDTPVTTTPSEKTLFDRRDDPVVENTPPKLLSTAFEELPLEIGVPLVIACSIIKPESVSLFQPSAKEVRVISPPLNCIGFTLVPRALNVPFIIM